MSSKLKMIAFIILTLSMYSIAQQKQMELSPTQKIAWAEKEYEGLKTISRNVQEMLNEARKGKDLVKITCLNEKLTQVNVIIRNFEERLEELKESIRTNNKELTEHNYRVLVILVQRVQNLRAEAEGCVGVEAWEIGKTAVEFTIDPNIPQEDPTVEPPPIDRYIRPPTASSYY